MVFGNAGWLCCVVVLYLIWVWLFVYLLLDFGCITVWLLYACNSVARYVVFVVGFVLYGFVLIDIVTCLLGVVYCWFILFVFIFLLFLVYLGFVGFAFCCLWFWVLVVFMFALFFFGLIVLCVSVLLLRYDVAGVCLWFRCLVACDELVFVGLLYFVVLICEFVLVGGCLIALFVCVIWIYGLDVVISVLNFGFGVYCLRGIGLFVVLLFVMLVWFCLGLDVYLWLFCYDFGVLVGYLCVF